MGEEADLVTPALRAVVDRDTTELWLGATGHLPLDATTLVVASPYADITEERAQELHRRLLTLPAHHRVIVVLAPTSRPAPVIDLTEDATPHEVIDLNDRHQAAGPSS